MKSASDRPRDQKREIGRRDLLKGAGIALGALAVPRVLGGCAAAEGDDRATPNVDPIAQARQSIKAITADIGIVGAGIAGLACAYELKRAGVAATIHEGSTRIGGRIWSMGGSFAGPVDWKGQVIERGGELIDNAHKAMLGYAKELKLAREDVLKPARETLYRFNGQAVPEHIMVEEFRVLVDAMRDDLRTASFPTADAFTPADRALDYMSFAEYLETRGAPPNIKALLTVAYEIEYGVPIDKLSSLAFLYFAKASKQSKLRLWGNFSDERFHIIGGNEQIPAGLAAKMPGQIKLGRKLLAVKKRSDGRIDLTFSEGKKTIVATHDAVVLALPFHLLRDVAFDASVGLPDSKKYAIANAVCGDNSKLMIGFNGQPWVERGANGACYSDLPYLQTTWETNPSLGNASRGVITDYTGGALARSLSNAQLDAARFLDDFDRMIPGAKARVRREQNKIVCHLEHWPSSPWSKGAYTANQPGYFTTIEGNPAKPVGNLYFAGEATDSFYNWQGFMEGGALSGLRAASEVSNDF